MRRDARSIALGVALILALGAALAACDEAEQGRILRYEKGTYLGPKDTPVSQETEAKLRDRAAMQRGI